MSKRIRLRCPDCGRPCKTVAIDEAGGRRRVVRMCPVCPPRVATLKP
jgi:hypothetical protein